MGTQRWIYILLIAVGAVFGIAIAGVPSRHYDPPLRIVSTTTTTALTPTTQR